MNLFLWITIGFIIAGFVFLSFTKKKIEHRPNPTNSSIIWWVVGTAGWGVASIALITWAFYTIM
ncbi:hypothetical protein LS684_09950 [Cytobacillus spongiae]|uniref:hypothetical protein n=1 Tax=Cytobacillus spongiae TaxID=2901381 RepID=UPI001F3083A3|nr:hypothetical protein [Cytobacillus spongiae]UII57712.1 hypothetical protein LS684_09950 [Cytobacillus spongiae]